MIFICSNHDGFTGVTLPPSSPSLQTFVELYVAKEERMHAWKTDALDAFRVLCGADGGSLVHIDEVCSVCSHLDREAFTDVQTGTGMGVDTWLSCIDQWHRMAPGRSPGATEQENQESADTYILNALNGMRIEFRRRIQEHAAKRAAEAARETN